MRLYLEECDFTVKYLRGKYKYIVDALLRITINDLKEIKIKNNNVYKVSSRAMTNKALEDYEVANNKMYLMKSINHKF